MKRLLLAAAALLMSVGACVSTPDSPVKARGEITPVHVADWRDEIIYQIVVDRFYDGDPNNDYNVERSAPGRYHGGDWQGIIDKLDYLQELGVTALWISPVVRNIEEDAGFASYHGYWTQDFLSVNPHFGDLEDLRRLVDECHKRGIKVILDVVTNHIGQLFFYDINGNGRPDEMFIGSGDKSPMRRITEWDPDYDSRGIQGWTSLGEFGLAPIVWVRQPEINRMPPRPSEFYNDNWYHRRGRVTVWGREQEACSELGLSGNYYEPNNPCSDYIREQEIYGDFPGGLKDLATEKPEVREALTRVFKYWIEVADFDGFRIDTVKHVEHDFWKYFCKEIRRYARQELGKNFFIFGEVFSGLDWLIASYVGEDMLDGAFYFSQKYWVFDGVFKYGEPTSKVEELYNIRIDGQFGMRGYPVEPNEFGPTDEDGNGVPPRSLLVNFMDNHDVARFLFDKPSIEALHSALVYLFTWDGIPSIYYGTEQQFSGGNDPANREDMWDPRNMPVDPQTGRRYEPFNTTNPTFRTMKTLIAIRKAYAPLRRGGVTFRWVSHDRSDGSSPDAGILAYERTYKGQTVLVVINVSDTKTSYTHSSDGHTMTTGFSQGTRLINVYCGDHPCSGEEGGTFLVGSGGELDLALGPREAVILVPESDVVQIP